MEIQQDKMSKKRELGVFLFVVITAITVISAVLVKEKKECTRLACLMGSGKDICATEARD